jgi:hypothetical protein
MTNLPFFKNAAVQTRMTSIPDIWSEWQRLFPLFWKMLAVTIVRVKPFFAVSIQPQTARSEVESAMATVFDREFSAVAASADRELAHAIEVHQQTLSRFGCARR